MILQTTTFENMLDKRVAEANRYINAIESGLMNDKVQAGDIVELTTKHGDYFKNAHIDNFDYDSGRWNICEVPMVPFVFFSDDKGSLSFSTGGGAWGHVPKDLKYLGKRKKNFMIFKHNIFPDSGSIPIEVMVNVWEYKEPESLYGEYSTKDYLKQYFTRIAGKAGKSKSKENFSYHNMNMTFESPLEYEAWRDTFRGVEFQGGDDNQLVVFYYKSLSVLLSKEEYDTLNLPVDMRQCNGVIAVKVLYDDIAHTVTEYRYTNSGDELRSKGVKPYQLARSANNK